MDKGDDTLSDAVRRLAAAVGIDAIGFAEAAPFSDYSLPRSPRRDPRLALPNARSIIVTGIYIGGLTLPAWDDPRYGRTSRLYLSGFFLDVVEPLRPIAELLAREGFESVVCDSSADERSVLPLKLAAVRAGLGWQGRHSLLISKTYGTFLALGGIITDAVLEYKDESEPDRCGKCAECRTSCPVAALDTPYVLQRERCLSLLLQDEPLPGDVHQAIGNRVGDCEVCQDACPWNRRHLRNPLATDLTKSFQGRVRELEELFSLPSLSTMSEERYAKELGCLHTGIPCRIFARNVRIARKNA